MSRKVFFSFHYMPDCQRASLVRNIGMVDGNAPVSDNDWEAVTRGGDAAIKGWIDSQLSGRSCSVVLIGAETAGRKWINYEIENSWNAGKGLLGIHIHNLKDLSGRQTRKGKNPFEDFTMNNGKDKLSNWVMVYDPPYKESKAAYKYISDHMSDWVEDAIKINKRS